MWTEPTANGVQLLKCFDCSEELKLASCLCICASCLYSSLCSTAPLRVLHVMSPAPASYLRPTPLCDRHLPASHVIIPSFFSLSLSLSLSLSPATTHLSRVMRQLRFSLAHPWVNSNMAYWLTPECAHEAENTDEKVFFFAHF